MKLVVFLGYKGSGKTTAIEATVKLLVHAGLKVATIKHIPEEGFSMDTPGKDTWRHLRAGAAAVVAVSPHELATIRRAATARMTAWDVARTFAGEGFDFVLVEGMNRRIGLGREAVYLLCASGAEEAADLLKEHRSVRCILGKVSVGKSGKSLRGVPYIQLPGEGRKLMGILRGG